MYVQAFFVLDRIKQMAPQHPDWKDKGPFTSVLKGDMKSALAGGEHAVVALMAAAHSGMTTDEFEKNVTDWITTTRHPKTGKLFTEMAFQPMLELLTYLRANGFKTFIVSGGGIEFMRPWAAHYQIGARHMTNAPKVHHAFRLEDRDSGRLLVETLEIHTLELGWYNLQESELETASLLDRWLYWLLHAHQYDAKKLGSLFPQPEFQKATDSIDRIAKKTEDKAMYDTREKAIRDQQWILNAARREGREEGEIKGREEGREEGEIKGREEGELFGKIRMLQNLLSLPQSTDQELHPRSRTELETLATELQAQLRKRMT
jgi:hypothetical protein